jgi:uncharacterized protein DUF1698
MLATLLRQVRARLLHRDGFDHYVTTAPSAQNAVDIFRGQWSSLLPDSLGVEQSGRVALFRDARISWMDELIGGVAGKKILELGPLEGGHTWMLQQLGAESILAIEANTRAFLRCLIVKELLGMHNARFMCGDFLEFLRQNGESFPLCLASGVLYHMQNPAQLIALLARRCSGHLFIWSHYYDPALVASRPEVADHFSGSMPREHEGFVHTLHRYKYKNATHWGGFCGAGREESCWMTREDLLRCLVHFGFEVQAIGFDDPNHPNGPALAIVAKRTDFRPGTNPDTPKL